MPPHEDLPGRAPVTAADVTLAVRLTVAALGGAPAELWGNQAGSLEWDCWETVEHMLAAGVELRHEQGLPAAVSVSHS
jgi:hypothetical protein